MRKLVHLTDLHVGDNASGDGRFRKLVARLTSNSSPVSPDNAVLLITGDFVERDQGNAYRTVAAGLGDLRDHGFDLTGCPGNHDLFDAQGRLRQLNMAKFNEHVFSHFNHSDRFRLVGTGAYPRCQIVDEAWTLIALNSEAEARDGLLPKGIGRLGQAQIAALGQLLDSPEVRGPVMIALHHDPFNGGVVLELDDRKMLFEVLRSRIQRVQGILFGHLHDRKNYRDTRRNQIEDWITSPLLLDGGVSANFDAGPQDEARIRLLNVMDGRIASEDLFGVL